MKTSITSVCYPWQLNRTALSSTEKAPIDISGKPCSEIYSLYRLVPAGYFYQDTYDGDGYGAKFKKRFLDLTDDDITAIYNSARKCSDDERKALEKKHGKNSDAARFFNEYKVDMERSEFIKKAMHNVQERRRTIEQRNIQAKAQKEREEAQKRQEQDKKSFIAENMNTALALLKNSYFASYPKGQGYPPIGKSLETFFARPTWEITPGKLGALSSGWIAKFHGIAELKNGNKARFTWAFFIESI